MRYNAWAQVAEALIYFIFGARFEVYVALARFWRAANLDGKFCWGAVGAGVFMTARWLVAHQLSITPYGLIEKERFAIVLTVGYLFYQRVALK